MAELSAESRVLRDFILLKLRASTDYKQKRTKYSDPSVPLTPASAEDVLSWLKENATPNFEIRQRHPKFNPPVQGRVAVAKFFSEEQARGYLWYFERPKELMECEFLDPSAAAAAGGSGLVDEEDPFAAQEASHQDALAGAAECMGLVKGNTRVVLRGSCDHANVHGTMQKIHRLRTLTLPVTFAKTSDGLRLHCIDEPQDIHDDDKNSCTIS